MSVHLEPLEWLFFCFVHTVFLAATIYGRPWCSLQRNSDSVESLEAIPKDAALKNKVYHFVFALVYVQQNDIDHYYFALEHIEAALKIDNNYHKAFTVKQYLLVHLYPEKYPIILEELDAHYRCIVSDGKEHNELAEYYQFRGLIQLQADMYSTAIDDFRNAENMDMILLSLS